HPIRHHVPEPAATDDGFPERGKVQWRNRGASHVGPRIEPLRSSCDHGTTVRRSPAGICSPAPSPAALKPASAKCSRIPPGWPSLVEPEASGGGLSEGQEGGIERWMGEGPPRGDWISRAARR